MSALHVVSLFAGIGGLEKAAHDNGIPTVLSVEIDQPARGVLAVRYPGTSLLPDVREVTADDLRAAGAVPARTILTAGWPCQGNSVAGRRGGMADPRSGLWSHVVRLLAEFRPAWFVGENVPGLLSVNDGRDFGVVVDDLAGLGMGLAWRILDAQHFGVPQRRRRVVIVGRAGDDGRAPARVLLEPEGSGGDSAAGHETGEDVAPDTAGRVGDRGVVRALTTRAGSTFDDQQTDQLVVHPIQDGRAVDKAQNGVGLGDEGDPAYTLDTTGAQAVTVTGQVTHALTSEGGDASEDGTGRGTPIIDATLTAGTATPGVNAPGRRQEDDANLVAFHLTQDPIAAPSSPRSAPSPADKESLRSHRRPASVV